MTILFEFIFVRKKGLMERSKSVIKKGEGVKKIKTK